MGHRAAGRCHFRGDDSAQAPARAAPAAGGKLVQGAGRLCAGAVAARLAEWQGRDLGSRRPEDGGPALPLAARWAEADPVRVSVHARQLLERRPAGLRQPGRLPRIRRGSGGVRDRRERAHDEIERAVGDQQHCRSPNRTASQSGRRAARARRQRSPGAGPGEALPAHGVSRRASHAREPRIDPARDDPDGAAGAAVHRLPWRGVRRGRPHGTARGARRALVRKRG
jgi:hypothetical protein